MRKIYEKPKKESKTYGNKSILEKQRKGYGIGIYRKRSLFENNANRMFCKNVLCHCNKISRLPLYPVEISGKE